MDLKEQYNKYKLLLLYTLYTSNYQQNLALYAGKIHFDGTGWAHNDKWGWQLSNPGNSHNQVHRLIWVQYEKWWSQIQEHIKILLALAWEYNQYGQNFNT